MIGNPSLSDCLDIHDIENKPLIRYFVEEFHDAESVCFPLSTRYSTNAAIANCANHLIPYTYVDNIKIAKEGADEQVIDCLSRYNREKIGGVGLGFSANLFEKLIAAPLLYIDNDLVAANYFYKLFDLLSKKIDQRGYQKG